MTQTTKPCCNNKLTGFSIGVNFGGDNKIADKPIDVAKINLERRFSNASVTSTHKKTERKARRDSIANVTSSQKKNVRNKSHASRHCSNNSLKKTREEASLKCQQDVLNALNAYLQNCSRIVQMAMSELASYQKQSCNLTQYQATDYFTCY